MALLIDINRDTKFVQNIRKKININDLIKFIKDNFMNNTDNLDLKENDIFSNGISYMPMQYNEMKEVDKYPTNIHNIIHKVGNIQRIGVIKYNDEQKNISLYMAILTCIKHNFRELGQTEQQNYVKQLNYNILTFVNNKFSDFRYKDFGWNKNEVMDNIRKMQINNSILKVLTDYLHLNIFIIDTDNDKITISDKISQFRKSIILFCINGTNYEPLIYKSELCYLSDTQIVAELNANNNMINKMFEVDNDKYMSNELEKYLSHQKEITLSYHEKKILSIIAQNNIVAEKESKDCKESKESIAISIPADNNTTINNIDEYSAGAETECAIDDISHTEQKQQQPAADSLMLTLRNKKYNEKTMKLDEIQKDATILNIPLMVNSKKKTKGQLIAEIKQYFS